MKKITVPAKIESIEVVTDWIDEQLEEKDCSFKMITQVNIVLDEILSNIAKYAYEDQDGDITVECDIDSSLHLTFKDHGIAYNPLEKEDPDITASAEDRDIGGLGIYLTKKMTDAISYEYADGQNVLTIQKQIV